MYNVSGISRMAQGDPQYGPAYGVKYLRGLPCHYIANVPNYMYSASSLYEVLMSWSCHIQSVPCKNVDRAPIEEIDLN